MQSFYNVNLSIKDLIRDDCLQSDILWMTAFHTLMLCGESIESLKLVDLQQEIAGGKIVSTILLVAVVKREEYKIILETENALFLTSVLTFNDSAASKDTVMSHLRDIFE